MFGSPVLVGIVAEPASRVNKPRDPKFVGGSIYPNAKLEASIASYEAQNHGMEQETQGESVVIHAFSRTRTSGSWSKHRHLEIQRNDGRAHLSESGLDGCALLTRADPPGLGSAHWRSFTQSS